MKFLKFSSLVRFVFTGGFASAIGYLMYYLNSDLFCSAKSCCGNATVDNTALDFLSSIGGIEITITIAVMYFLGVILFGLRMWLSQLSRNCKVSKFVRWLQFPFIRLDINHLCDELKENRKEGRHIPDWIYMVKQPSELLDRVVEYMFKGAGEDADDEMRYMNETAITLIFILYFAILIQLGILMFDFLIKGNFSVELINTSILVFGGFGLGLFVLSMIAKTFGIKFLMKLGYMENVCKGLKDKSELPFSPNEYPTAFVLIRTTIKEQGQEVKLKLLKGALSSIASQDYPNIKVIVLEDVDDSIDRTEEMYTKKAIEKFQEEKSTKLNISYNMSKCGGPAGAAYHIRKLFLTVASKRDVAIMLDDDDTLRYDSAISDIMLNLCMNQAEICLCSFETIDDQSLNICNHGGKTHNAIVEKLEKKASIFDHTMIMASSIGWTKAYTYKQVEKYNKHILGTSLKGQMIKEKAKDIYINLKRYEDFPDILVLASSIGKEKSPRITGVSNPTHNYRKHTGGTTTANDLEDFENARPKFLALTLNLAFAMEKKDWSITDKNVQNIVKYVLFKAIQISNIMIGHRRKFEEEGYVEWKNFKTIDCGYFYNRLCEVLQEKVNVELLNVKLCEIIPKKDLEKVNKKYKDCQKCTEEQKMRELMKVALEKVYEDNKENIDIENITWRMEVEKEIQHFSLPSEFPPYPIQ